MAELFAKSEPVVEPTQEANVTPEIDDVKATNNERTFTASEVEKIVKDRLVREQKKYAKQLDETKKPMKAEVTGNVEEDLRSKLSQAESRLQEREQKLMAMKAKQLRSLVEKTASKFDCNDPELLTDYLLGKSLVHFDDDDELVTENADNNLDELIKSELSKRPHLVKPSAANGTGSKAPGAVKTFNSGNIKSMSSEEFAAYKESQGIKANGGKLFG